MNDKTLSENPAKWLQLPVISELISGADPLRPLSFRLVFHTGLEASSLKSLVLYSDEHTHPMCC